ncbi:MAG: hypothetical protein PHU31_08090, partial [Anaerotignum sp.]|nr:hypothetical protein [Anaerotignum sp.]
FSWPLSEMPEVLVKAAQFLPPTHFLSPARSIVLMGVGFETESIVYSRDMLLYLAMGAFVLSVLAFSWKVYRVRRKEQPKLTKKEVVQA